MALEAISMLEHSLGSYVKIIQLLGDYFFITSINILMAIMHTQ